MVLLSVISSSKSLVWFYCIDLIYNTVSIQSQHIISLVTAFSYDRYSIYISCSKYCTCYSACSVMCYFSFTLSLMLSTFQIILHNMCYIFSWCSFSCSADRSHIDWLPTFSWVASLVSPHSSRTSDMFLFSAFSPSISILLDLTRECPSIASKFRGLFPTELYSA